MLHQLHLTYTEYFLYRLLVSIGIGLPISYYLWQRGGFNKPSSTSEAPTPKAPRGANQEYSQGAEGNENVGLNVNSRTFTRDEVGPSLLYFAFRACLALSSLDRGIKGLNI